MRLTIEEHPERIKRYRHVKPARRTGGGACSARCPGTLRTCTLERAHPGPHIAHGAFRRVVAVWDKGLKVQTLEEDAIARGKALQNPAMGRSRFLEFFNTVKKQIARREHSFEEIIFLAFGVAMVGFVIDWALRIMGLK